MSKKSIKEYIAEKKRSYASYSRERKHRVLNAWSGIAGFAVKYPMRSPGSESDFEKLPRTIAHFVSGRTDGTTAPSNAKTR